MSENVSVSLPMLTLSDEEQTMLSLLRGRLLRFFEPNRRQQMYYEGRHKFLQLGMSVPPSLRDIGTTVGWPGTVVDVLEERLDWLGWTNTDNQLNGLDEIFADNYLEAESSRVHIDALICGTGFASVGRGDTSAGEPDVLISVESACNATALWDYRTRRIEAGLSQTRNELGQVVMESLYLPDQTILLQMDPLNTTSMWVVDRDIHNLGRPMMAKFQNKDRAVDVQGRSEITRPIRYYTDAACRTLLGMEINREFYTAPQRYALGAEPEQFGITENSSPEDKLMAGWSVAMGRLNIIPATEDGDIPQMGQFSSNPPTPYIEQLRAYASLVSAESGIPLSSLGFSTDNPPSADSIRAGEARLVKRAERRQSEFGRAWREIGALSLLARDGELDPDFFRGLRVKWQDAATPTRSAQADEALKLTTAGILPPDSTVTYDRIGLSPQEQAQVRADKRKAQVAGVIAGLAHAPAPAAPVQAPTAADLATRRVPKAEQ